KAQPGADHRGDEQQRDRRSEAVAGEKGQEQEDDHRGNEQSGQDSGKNRAADDPTAPVAQSDFLKQAGMFLAAALEDARLQPADAVDDPGKPSGADVEEGAEPSKEEYRC